MTESEASRPDPMSMSDRERLGMLQSDRACIKCAYNLIGQDIIREPHYRMAVIRCPECGTVTTMQEYPLLGQWANRWAIALGVLWAIMLLAFFGGTIAASTAIGFGMREGTIETFATHISQRYIDDVLQPQRVAAEAAAAEAAAEAEGGDASSGASPTIADILTDSPGLADVTFTGDPAHDELVNLVINLSTQVDTIRLRQRARNQGQQTLRATPWLDIDGGWWRTQDPASLVASAGGWWRAIDKATFLWSMLAIAFLSVVWGMLWSNLLIHLSRPWLILVACLLLAPAIVIHCTVQVQEVESLSLWTQTYARRIAAVHLGFTTVKVYFASFVVMLSIGMFTGRPLLRGLIRVFLPPRLRVPLAGLWLAAGKPPPRRR